MKKITIQLTNYKSAYTCVGKHQNNYLKENQYRAQCSVSVSLGN